MYLRSPAYIVSNGLVLYILLPMLLSGLAALLITALAYFGMAALFLEAGERLSVFFGAESLPGWIQWILNILSVFLGGLAAIILWRTAAALLVMPFLGSLLERIEAIELGHARETSFGEDLRNSLIGAWLALQHALAGLLILLLSWPLGPLGAALNIAAQSYFSGRASFDFIFEKEAHDLAGRRALTRKHRPELFGAGLAYLLTLLIPVLGILFAPVAGLTAAARLYYAQSEKSPAIGPQH